MRFLGMVAPLLLLTIGVLHADGTITVTTQKLYDDSISPLIYGEFVEFINDMIPGMWAEKIQDRSFEGITQPGNVYPPGTNWVYPRWTPFVTGRPQNGPAFDWGVSPEPLPECAKFALDADRPLGGKACAKVTVGAGDGRAYIAGIAQGEIAVVQGQRIQFEMSIRTDGADIGSVYVLLGRNCGAFFRQYDSLVLTVTPGDWTKLSGSMISSVTDDDAQIAIGIDRAGTFWIDKVSLMPVDGLRGWRADVVKAVREGKPGIIRFGGSSLWYYDWEIGIGPRDTRPSFRNDPWGNTEENDVGIYEFLDLCELVGAEPMVCLNAKSAPLESILHELEFILGPADSPYGKIRAQMGHPQPFSARYFQIGNEQLGPEYEKTLDEWARAIRSRYPKLILMGSFPSDTLLENVSDAIDVVCPHYYGQYDKGRCMEFPDLMAKIREKAKNKNLKLGVTEWNLTAGGWVWGRSWMLTQLNALNAAMMLQTFQRYGDGIRIANRSNLVNSCCSGSIQTNRATLYLTPTYYAQKGFATLSGDVALKVGIEQNETLSVMATQQSKTGEIVLSVVNTAGDPMKRAIDLSAMKTPLKGASSWTLSAKSLDVANDFVKADRVVPVELPLAVKGKILPYTFPPYSVTMLRLR